MLTDAQVWVGLLLAFLTLCVMIWGFGYRMGKLITTLTQVAKEVSVLGKEVKVLIDKVSCHEKKIAVIESQIEREAG